MLALAYQMDRMIETGIVRDRAEMARVTGFDDSRISQIMNLLWLAPNIQEAVLFAEIGDGRDWVTAKKLLPIARCASWAEQRRRFATSIDRPFPDASRHPGRSPHPRCPARQGQTRLNPMEPAEELW